MTDDSLKSTRVVLFTDLDDSLIQTKAKLPVGAATVPGATDRDGQPLSWFTQAQASLLQMFAGFGASIIPVTGRNTDALQRVNYPFSDYCVVSHGAVVLSHTGRVCEHWLTSINDELNQWPELLQRSHQAIQDIIRTHNLDARSRVIIDQDIPAYISIKGTAPALATVRQHNPLDGQFYRHENGRNHALLPPYARKKRAVEHVAQRLGLGPNDLTIGLGDSLSDLAFMQACHLAMLPSNSQIAKEGLQQHV